MRFQEYMSCMSKLEDAGSYHVGIEEESNTNSSSKYPVIKGFKLKCNQDRLKECLLDKLNTVLILGSDESVTKGHVLIAVYFHDVGHSGIVLEIAVRFVAGIVFYEEGPEAYETVEVFQISDQTSFLCGVNRDVSYDSMIEDIFSKVAGNELVIYPRSCDDSDASVSHVRKRLVCEDSFWEGAFVYTAKCLLVTLNADTRREKAKVPECLERDVCIFTKDYPPIVLSLVRDSNKLSKSEKYNKLVGRKMTFLLRNTSCVSVMSEVLDLTNESKIRIEDMELESIFAIKSSLVMDHDKLRDAVGSFLRCIGLSETFYCFHKDSAERKDVFLTQDELPFLMEALDGVKEIGRRQVTSWAPFLASEVAVRLAKTSSTFLKLTPAHRRITDMERLMEGNPLLEVERGITKECAEMTRFQHYVSECSGVKTDSPNTNVWIFETELAGEMRVRKSTRMAISGPKSVRAPLPKIQTGPLVRMDENIVHPRVIFPKEYGIPLERDRIPVRLFAPYYPERHTRPTKDMRKYHSSMRKETKEKRGNRRQLPASTFASLTRKWHVARNIFEKFSKIYSEDI